MQSFSFEFTFFLACLRSSKDLKPLNVSCVTFSYFNALLFFFFSLLDFVACFFVCLVSFVLFFVAVIFIFLSVRTAIQLT